MHQRVRTYPHYQRNQHNETHIKPFDLRPRPKWRRSKIFQQSRFRMDQNKNSWAKQIILTSQRRRTYQSYQRTYHNKMKMRYIIIRWRPKWRRSKMFQCSRFRREKNDKTQTKHPLIKTRRSRGLKRAHFRMVKIFKVRTTSLAHIMENHKHAKQIPDFLPMKGCKFKQAHTN